MVIGRLGVNGVLARKHVIQEPKRDHELAQILRPSLMEHHAQEVAQIQVHACLSCVPVRAIYYSI